MLHIYYVFNEKYAPYAGVSIVSLLENNKSADKIKIYMLGEGVREESQKKLEMQIKKYGRDAVFIDATSLIERMKTYAINDYRGSYAPNLKFLVSWFVPEDVERIIYLDSDTIIEGSLEELNTCDMQGMPLGMCMDSVCKEHKKEVGFQDDEAYFNSGVILYDMKRWRDMDCTRRMIEHLNNERCHYMAPDQDLINIVLKGEISDLGPAYNMQPLHWVYPYKTYARYFGQEAYYSQDEIEEAKNKPRIYHTFRYLGQFPWHKNSLHPNVDLFDRYLELSDWAGYERQITEQNDIVFRVERCMYRLLPRKIFIGIFKLCYEIFMWKSALDSTKGRNNVRM